MMQRFNQPEGDKTERRFNQLDQILIETGHRQNNLVSGKGEEIFKVDAPFLGTYNSYSRTSGMNLSTTMTPQAKP
jgi:uncharacterized protein YfaP (DUF2135 family)